MGKYIPVEPEKWGEMVKAMAEVTRLKAEVERLKMEESKLLTLCETYEGDLERLRASSFVTAVPVEEYEKLKAEVERLEQQVKYWRIEAETDHARWLRVLEDVERLRKAGDKLVEAIQEMDVIIDMDSEHPEVNAWNAAKEGKQS